MLVIGENYIFYIIAIFASIICGIYVTVYAKGYDPEKRQVSLNILDILKNNITYLVGTIIICMLIYILATYSMSISIDISNTDGILRYAEMAIMLPSLISIAIVDLKHRIVPNRLNMNILLISLAFTMLNGLLSSALLLDRIYSFVIGLIIYTIMYLIGYVLYGKNALGLGDIKLILAVSFSLGFFRIIDATIITFVIASIASICISIYRGYKNIRDDYIPFATFLVISIIISLLTNPGFVVTGISKIFGN